MALSYATKHAASNPAQWVNLIALASGLIAVVTQSDWVKQNAPQVVGALLLVGNILPAVLQWMRDQNNPPDPTQPKE